MYNSTHVFGHELLGRNHVTSTDIAVGSSVITVAFGVLNLFLLWKISIFHNAFGRILATRTVIEMCSSALHTSFAAYATLSQRSDYSPLWAVVVGTLGYDLAAMSCAMHVLLALNRFVSVYFPMRYPTIFSRRNSIIAIGFALVEITAVTLLGYNLIPCNTVGFSATHYSYIVLNCPDPGQERPFHFARFINITCGSFFCFGAIVIDTATIRRLFAIKKKKAYISQQHFNVQFRFTLQSLSQNIPMFVEIILLGLSDDSTDDSKTFVRIASFVLTRVTDFVNSISIIFFNPEVRRFLGLRFNQLGPTGSSSVVRTDTY
ncbi:hypothetical protein QR680_016391 [Steinernema hermaphroditum]|uniref:7TM GPCR serpentine receptor class x (Srx) domain-containing protein n=1 Tax=Steinernema hermaphroditum TaxID=289476 RepID=A0AA39HC22_9BILA|nr:hypothetical protein QR680_016391 [Steinernema hermaphroditum]